MDRVRAGEAVSLTGPVHLRQTEVLEQVPKRVIASPLGNGQGYINFNYGPFSSCS